MVLKVDIIHWLPLVFFLSSPGEGGEFVGWQGRQSPTVSTSLSLPWGWAHQLGFSVSVLSCVTVLCLALFLCVWKPLVLSWRSLWLYMYFGWSLVLKIAHRTLNYYFNEKDGMMASSPVNNNRAVLTADYCFMSKDCQHLLKNLLVKVTELVVLAAWKM